MNASVGTGNPILIAQQKRKDAGFFSTNKFLDN